MPLHVKRVYSPPQRDDGVRILVDRLWPRGMSREHAAIDHWFRECAPSAELRKWFGHNRAKWNGFRKRYFAELGGKEEILAPIRALAGKKRATLLFGAADIECSNAVALMQYLVAQGRGVQQQRKAPPAKAVTGARRKRPTAKRDLRK